MLAHLKHNKAGLNEIKTDIKEMVKAVNDTTNHIIKLTANQLETKNDILQLKNSVDEKLKSCEINKKEKIREVRKNISEITAIELPKLKLLGLSVQKEARWTIGIITAIIGLVMAIMKVTG